MQIDYHRNMGTPEPDEKDKIVSPWQNADYQHLTDVIKQIGDPATTDIIFF